MYYGGKQKNKQSKKQNKQNQNNNKQNQNQKGSSYGGSGSYSPAYLKRQRGGRGCLHGVGYSINPGQQIMGGAGPVGAVVGCQDGGNAHHKYDCKQPNWGPECL